MMNKKDTWFRQSGATSTLCVPPTPGGTLAKMVEKNLQMGRQPEGTRTKVVEGNGICTSRGLVKSKQFPEVVANVWTVPSVSRWLEGEASLIGLTLIMRQTAPDVIRNASNM